MTDIRSATDVAKRCLALIAVVERCNGTDGQLIAWAEEHHIADYFSPLEREFFYSDQPSQQDVVTFSWRSEALIPLLWALSRIAAMPPLNEQVSLSDYPVVKQAAADPAAFIESARLRPSTEIEQAENDLYEQHWSVRDAELFGRAMPPELNPGIVYERRYGLSWCAGWGDDWDDVPTDT